MGENTKISWASHTFNPWWGCVKVSPACARCYADTFAHRLGEELWGEDKPRKFFKEKHWNEPKKWDKAAKEAGVRARVFCASMADVFEDRADLNPWRAKLWDLIAETPNLDWLLLTKRPELMTELAPASWSDKWPLNVWAGTTVENQEWADKRLPALAAVPAAIRFLSVEPMLGPVDLTDAYSFVDWVIVGAESGHGARTMDLDWVRAIRDKTTAAGVAFFLKQFVEENGITKYETPELDGKRWTEVPLAPARAA